MSEFEGWITGSGYHANTKWRMSSFSLVEIMIAIIILGFGLLMIAAVLPLVWRSSLDLTYQTRHETAAKIAEKYVKDKCLVDSSANLYSVVAGYDPLVPPELPPIADSPDTISYCMLGDLDTLDQVLINPLGLNPKPFNIPMVHLLHAENWLYEHNNPQPSPYQPNPTATDYRVVEAPIELEQSWDINNTYANGTPANGWLSNPPAPYSGIGRPIVPLRDRLFPPIPESIMPVDPQFSELLRDRKYTWAVFHRLQGVPGGPSEPRRFSFLFVTLRRGDGSRRYARQDPGSLPRHAWYGVDFYNPPRWPSPPQAPQALPADEDVAFPVPWRVPLVLWESQSGVPGVAFVGIDPSMPNADSYLPPDAAATAPVNNSLLPLAQMFPQGSVFIDEMSGLVFRVSNRDYLDVGNYIARLTLEEPVRATDLTAPEFPQFDARYRNRIVWVFPPSAASGSGRDDPGDPVSFSGPCPVVNVEIKSLLMTPPQ